MTLSRADMFSLPPLSRRPTWTRLTAWGGEMSSEMTSVCVLLRRYVTTTTSLASPLTGCRPVCCTGGNVRDGAREKPTRSSSVSSVTAGQPTNTQGSHNKSTTPPL
ncbi:uncharacterized protein ACB058_004208 isoform 2-T2 [Synchiropus picturatus]